MQQGVVKIKKVRKIDLLEIPSQGNDNDFSGTTEMQTTDGVLDVSGTVSDIFSRDCLL